MVFSTQGRTLLVYVLAISSLLALMGGAVSAGGGMKGKPLAGALQIKSKTCKGSPARRAQLRRLCHHARVQWDGKHRHPGKHHDPAPGASPAPIVSEPAGSSPASDPATTPQASPGPGPAEPPPVPAGTTPDPEPTPQEPPSPGPGPAEPPPPAPDPEPEPEPGPEPGPSPAPEPNPEPEPIPAGTPPPAPAPSPAPSRSVYWGAWIGNHLTGTEAPWDMGAVTRLEQLAGKNLSVVNFSAPFANCSSSSCSFYNFPTSEFSSIRSHGSIPFYSWGSQSIPVSANLSQPDFQLSDVISGAHDAYIRQWATAAKNWGYPFFLRFNWEMNGGWFAWAEGVNGNQQGEYVAAWRHVHDIFTEVGATNATWVWCPNVDPDNIFQNLAPLYPGDAYVDWAGLDGYNWGTNPARPDKWRSFDSLYRATYDEITQTIAPSKPMIVSEIGSTEHGGSKAAWIADMLATVPADYPKIRGLLWFEKYDDSMDWPLGTSASATAAFAAGIQNSTYADNKFGSLGAGPVQPAG
jgi:mannan endo-1,4-beta-mannosidase